MIKKYFAILLALTGVLIQTACLAQKQVDDSIARKLNNVISDFKNKFQSPSVVVCLVQDKDIIFSSALGYTDLERKTPATIDAQYPIMSVSKTFTTTMLMQLAERGVVGLNDDVRKYVPEYKVKTSSGEMAHTTLLQLATHTSGLPRNSPADVTFTISWDKWVMMLADSPMVADGNQRFTVKDKNGNGVSFEFVSDGNGGISSLKLGQNVWYKE